jgi:hypothetical protein
MQEYWFVGAGINLFRRAGGGMAHQP